MCILSDLTSSSTGAKIAPNKLKETCFMRIAVSYDNGSVFQHFGKTEQFKIYNIENNAVVSTEIISSNGSGHSELVGILEDQGVDVLICGGIGSGALDDLDYAGIAVVSGADGNTDDAVTAFLRDELLNSGVTCNHHEEEQEAGHGCGGSCGTCGGCGHRRPVIEGPNSGKTVKVHYKGTFNDGSQFDSSYDRGEPLEFVCGIGMMIQGFDRAVVDMKPGEVRDIHLLPSEAYGEKDPDAVVTLDISTLEGSEDLTVGERVLLYNNMGQPVPVTVVAKDEKTISFDTNHEMAGKELNFRIELLEVAES